MTAQARQLDVDLTARPLPVFSRSVQALTTLHPDQGSAFKQYGDIILKDPGLALHALQQIAPAPGKSRRGDIGTMTQVTMLLGSDRVARIAQGRPLLENTLRGMAQAGYARAAARAFHAAFQAWDWAHIKKDHAPEEIFLATLLYDVAELALWVNAPDKIHEMRKLIFKDRLHTDEAQYLALGDSLEHFSRQIAVTWHLPPLLHEALRPENSTNPRTRGVILAVHLSRAAERGWYNAKLQTTLEQIADYLGAPLAETAQHIHRNAVRAAHEASFHDSRPAAALLPLLPGDDHVLLEEEFPEAAKKPAIAAAVKPQLSTPEPPARDAEAGGASEVCLIPQPERYAEALHTLQQGLGRLDLNAIMRTTVHGLHDGSGLNRVVFSMLTPDRKTLISRFSIGADNDPGFSRFRISLETPNLFGKLLEKPQSLWLNSGNRDKFWGLIPQDFKRIIKTNSFYVMSIFIDGKAIGLFYADRRGPDCELDAAAYQQFRQLCMVAGNCLASTSSKKT